MTDIYNDIESLKKIMSRLSANLKNESLRELIDSIVYECPICSDMSTDIIKLECCNKLICKPCNSKLNKCCFCRKIFNIKENENNELNLIIENVVEPAPEPAPAPEPEQLIDFCENDKKILILIRDEYIKLYTAGIIKHVKQQSYLTFEHPITKKKVNGTRGDDHTINYIIRESDISNEIQLLSRESNYKFQIPARKNTFARIFMRNNILINSRNRLWITSNIKHILAPKFNKNVSDHFLYLMDLTLFSNN